MNHNTAHKKANRKNRREKCSYFAYRDFNHTNPKDTTYGLGRRLYIFLRDGGLCWICGKPVDLKLLPSSKQWDECLTLDHIIPQSKGGTWKTSNLRAAHKLCNSIRGNNN